MKIWKQMVSMLLALTMLLSLAACAGPAPKVESAPAPESQPSGDALNQQTLDREDKELIAELIGGEDGSDMTDEELDALIDQLIGEEGENSTGEVVNLSTKPEKPKVEFTPDPDAYDEDGAMTQPFDQVYPELIEKEQVTFSGESILIKLKSNKLTDGLKAAGIGALEKIVPLSGSAWYEAKLTEGTDAKTALEAVRQLKEVLLAEYNYEVQVAALDDYKHFDKDKDEEFKKNGHNKDQWHFHYCGIPDGYEEMDKAGGDPSVVVAVIDSGVDYDHEDLKDNMWVNQGELPDNGKDDDGNGYIDDYYGVDIVAGKGNGDDTNGHGTHVAGIIAARNNNVGVLGIAYNVKIMSVKAAMHNGTLNQADIAKAVLYAYEMGAEVINMSFGGSACSIAVQDALATAYTRCVLVASAGNDGENNEPTEKDPMAIPNYPAALTYVLGVMSVDENGVESSFTNWDVKAFNGVEYELYAPGEQIMSTLPDNQYGYLSGTSMAAPVVSAFAAILRSEFADRDKYPTKFIYGQLSSTSEICPDCLAPQKHGDHNLPQITDLNAALTKLPKPEVNVQDYALFDDPKYSQKNNGDGVIDAGETIALGLTLRNRWGMSENTQVTIDTISASSGLADPYITIKNPTVDYGSVGTYSTQDCGKIMTDGLLTGWENPFLITVSEDCPNDYRFTLNVTITCENALDEADSTVYETAGAVNENVRAGVVLPTVIEEDMVLTADNLYIIPNATVIQEGVTVKVMPGTHIQFWSDDANDPYASNYIAYLLVNGNFLVEGTKEAPVYIYPSQLMDNYVVQFGGSGYTSLRYADVTNFYRGQNTGNPCANNRIDVAEHCIFRSSGTEIRFRYRSGTKVTDTNMQTYNPYLGTMNAKDCVFYKLAFNSGKPVLDGSFDRCIFVQCGVAFSSGDPYENCVFLGNSFRDQSKPDKYITSSIGAASTALNGLDNTSYKIMYRADTGTTYVQYNDWLEPKALRELADGFKGAFGGDLAKFETLEELRWLDNIYSLTSRDGGQTIYMGIHAGEDGRFLWYDGTPVDPAFLGTSGAKANNYNYFRNGKLYSKTDRPLYPKYLFEIPGFILPTDISFREYTIDIDPEITYQLQPLNAPVQLPANAFLYESSDESVLTVSETGLVTPVSKGTADVWVYSLDKAVKNHVTITIKDYVPLEGISFLVPSAEVAVGENIAVGCSLTPADTTRRNVVYTSSDESVAKVENGVVTGVSSGKVIITAKCENLTATMEVTVYNKATSLKFETKILTAAISDGTIPLPSVSINSGAETVLVWESTDAEVAYISDGVVVPKKAGTSLLIVSDLRSGLSCSVPLLITETTMPEIIEIQRAEQYVYILCDNGNLLRWDNKGCIGAPFLVSTDVVAFDVDVTNQFTVIAKKNGAMESFYGTGTTLYDQTTHLGETYSVVDVAVETQGTSYVNYYAVTSSGDLYAWGNINSNGALGLGTTQNYYTPTKVNISEPICEAVSIDPDAAIFLSKSGNLYKTGDGATPVIIARNITHVFDGGYFAGDGYAYGFYNNKLYQHTIPANQESYFVGYIDTNSVGGMRQENGRLYGINSDFTYFASITDPSALFYVPRPAYGASGDYYAAKDGIIYLNAYDGKNNYNICTPIVNDYISLCDSNITTIDSVLKQDYINLRFNKGIVNCTAKLYENGSLLTTNAIISNNKVMIHSELGFVENANYQLVIGTDDISAYMGTQLQEELVITFTYEENPNETTTEDTVPEKEPVIYETILDESVERIMSVDTMMEKLTQYLKLYQPNPYFSGNAILNAFSTDTNVEHWLRIQAPSVSLGSYVETPLSGNWWGTTNEKAIGLQLIDYADDISYARLMYAPYLTEAPENTFPFVTTVKLFNKYGDEVTTVGNEQVTFQVKFNRDMDTSIPLQVRFGSAYPYGDYEIEGKYVDVRTWEGTYTLNTLIENGNQLFTIQNGCSATEDLQLQPDSGRFGFVIDTTAAQALIMQGTATDTGIRLSWTQDDFKTLMGYNLYRATSEDGLYTRLNKTVIPADTMEWFDDTVEPGVVYYYNFTVVQTDLTESEPSGKISIMSKDTMAPNIYHSPVANAFTGSNLVLSATVTDNLNIAYANLYYRLAGTEEWTTIRMNKLNDKYSAIIPAAYITLAGVEYYIEAFDGISYTYKGSKDAPYTIEVSEAVEANDLGDVDGDGVVTNLDALKLLYAINDKYNMTAEEFARADLNGDGVLWAAEALQILKYVSGAAGSLKM